MTKYYIINHTHKKENKTTNYNFLCTVFYIGIDVDVDVVIVG